MSEERTPGQSGELHFGTVGESQSISLPELTPETVTSMVNNADAAMDMDAPAFSGTRAGTNLFGTLEIDGVGSYYAFALQSSTRTTWVLTDRDVFNDVKGTQHIVAILRIFSTGRMEGYGKTYLLTRMLAGLNGMVGTASQKGTSTAGFYLKGSYHSDIDDTMVEFTASMGGRQYYNISMVYEGFRLAVERYSTSLPFTIPRKLISVQDDKNKAAMVAGLGVRTFALLKRQRGASLDWYNEKRYKLIQTNEDFRAMMLNFLNAVQEAADSGRALLTTLDTETTGLNMLKLEKDNPLRDYVVAIPFGWKDDEAYVICTEMYYFHNVDGEEIYPLFTKLFSRNVDYSYQDIELDYCGQHFKFNRQNIMLVGVNAGFDIRAFLSHDCDVFFDEDIQIMHYNLATDWVQGRNGLKWMEHHYLGVETLELEDLFGPKHQDKYRYLSDADLALVYGGADGDFPRVLWRKLRRITPDNLYKLYKKYDMTTLYRTARATWLGMPIDDEKVKAQGEALLQDLETLKDFIYKFAYAANRDNLSEKANKLCQLLGVDSVEELEETGDGERMYRYPFTPANHKNLLFNILGYPVVKTSEKSHEPALDKFVLKKLAERKREEPVELLTVDIMSTVDPTAKLVDKDEFNRAMYPLAQVFQTYATLNKEYTSYYKPIMTNDLEGRMFYTFSLQRAATRRILSAGQTMKGSLKKLVVAPPGKLFMCFDASQIEYRHMASMAYIHTKAILQQEYPDDWEKRLDESGISRICTMMHNEEADYHTETASMMTGLPQYQIDSATRKMYKSIGFGIPYGLGDRSMCESLFGKITKENLVKTEQVLSDYKKRQFEIIRLLETVRDNAFRPAQIPDEFRKMLDIGDTHVGIVNNFVGFYRLFILEKLTRARTGRIRRQAGNCVIQGGAAELFRRMLYNFHQGCVKAGIDKKVEWLMLVHDEVDTIVDADIDVCRLIKTLYESCTLRYEDHIPYYIGIGFGHNWKEAKGDAAELPVIMVKRLVEAYDAGWSRIPCDGNQPENLLKLKRHYECDRVGEELEKIVGPIEEGHQWTDEEARHVDDAFSNYTVRAYMSGFLSKEHKAEYGKNVPMSVLLEDWRIERDKYGVGVDFLQEHFVDANDALRKLDLNAVDLEVTDSDDGMDITLGDTVSLTELELDTSDDMLFSREEDKEEELAFQREEEWFDESAMFDSGATQDDSVYESEEGYRYFKTEEEGEDNLEINENPTNAFDVFVSKKYTRKCIFANGEDTFCVMLNGTKFANKVGDLGRAIRGEFGSGSGTLVLFGDEIRRVSNVDLTPERLDNLDRLLMGEEVT